MLHNRHKSSPAPEQHVRPPRSKNVGSPFSNSQILCSRQSGIEQRPPHAARGGLLERLDHVPSMSATLPIAPGKRTCVDSPRDKKKKGSVEERGLALTAGAASVLAIHPNCTGIDY